MAGGSGSASRKRSIVLIAAMPSASEWCSRTYIATRPSERPGRNHTSQSGRERIEPPAPESLDALEDLGLAAPGRQRVDANVVAEIDARSVHPRVHRPLLRGPDDLPEPRREMQPRSIASRTASIRKRPTGSVSASPSR